MADNPKRHSNLFHGFQNGFAFNCVQCPEDRKELTALINRAAEILPRSVFDLLTATLDGLAYSHKYKGGLQLLDSLGLNPTSIMSTAAIQAFALCNRREPICAAGEIVTLDSVFTAFLGLCMALVLDEDYPETVYLQCAQNEKREIEFVHHKIFEMLELTAWCCNDCETVQNEYPCLGCPPSGFEAE